ncbi:MAG: hypothetical protein K9N10_11000 [Deltaproteobacteria bacterium]|nr:hypothetical protein [Deltaproteobacteria bacterium]
MTRKITLSVNNAPVEIDYFVEGFIDHTACGMVSSLEGVIEIEDLEISVEEERTGIRLNGAPLPINDFVNDLVRNTLLGMVSTLKGVSHVNQLHLNIQR